MLLTLSLHIPLVKGRFTYTELHKSIDSIIIRVD